jgi:hypothetical protein
MNQIEIYQTPDQEIEIKVQFEQDTVWLSQKLMGELFEKDSDTIGLHLKSIYGEGELDEDSTTEYFPVVQIEGKREVKRNIRFYNLDAIISVGYRVNSKRGTQFRIWATKRLKDYLVQGYVINEKRLKQKEQEVQHLKSGIQILHRTIDEKLDSLTGPESLKELLLDFTQGLTLLDDYDNENLDRTGLTEKPAIEIPIEEFYELIKNMLHDFNSEVFGKEKDNSFHSSVNQIYQGFNEKDLYPSLEEKAAMLLYLIVKNHSFVDGNKRIAAACIFSTGIKCCIFLQGRQLSAIKPLQH